MTRRIPVALGLAVVGVALLAWWFAPSLEAPEETSEVDGPSVGDPSLVGRGRIERPKPADEGPLVEVKVTGPDGAPVRSATVEFSAPLLGGKKATATDGTVRIGSRWLETPGAEVRIREALGADGEALRPLLLRVAEGGSPVRSLRMERSRDLEVRVVDEQGEPVAEAHVHLATQEQDEERAEATFFGTASWALTDRDGVAKFRLLPRLPLEVEVLAAASWMESTRESLGAEDVYLKVVVPAGVSIEGRAVDPSGRGVPSAKVTAGGWREGEWWEASTITDLDGRFRVATLPPSTTPRLVVDPGENTKNPSGLVPTTIDDVRTGTRDVVVRLVYAVSMKGEVVDRAGRPVGDVEVTAEPLEAALRSAPIEGEMLPGGRFLFARLSPGRYRLSAVSRGAEPGRSGPVEVTAPADGVTLVLRRAEVLAGRIVEERALGFGAWWFAGETRAEVAVDPSGTFEIRGIPDEVGTLYIGGLRSNRYALLRNVRPFREHVEVRLSEGSRIAGTVEIPEGKDPSLVYVVLAGDGFELWAEMDRDHSFHVLGVPPGSYEVSLAVDDVRGPVLARATAGATDLRVRLPR